MNTTIRLTGRLNPRSDWQASHCPIAKAIDVIDTRSTFLLLREAFYGTTRFDDFAERVGISQPVAAARLRDMVEQGLLTRQPYQEPGQRTRQEYKLTEKGSEFFPVLVALMEWGDRWEGPAGVELRHRDCGEAVRTELRCGAGHLTPVDEVDLVVRRGGRFDTGR